MFLPVLLVQIDVGGDPPRVWHPTRRLPGCAFTRSIGDSVAEGLGVYAVPECVNREIVPADKFLVVASDGVWEFITSQVGTSVKCVCVCCV